VQEKPIGTTARACGRIGIAAQCTPVIYDFEPALPPKKSGLLKKDDRITEINGEKLYDANGIYTFIKDHPALNTHSR